MARELILNERHSNFVVGLARSRVVQTIFEQMLGQTFGYQVFPFGYESTYPDLALARTGSNTGSDDFKRIRYQPDFRIYKKGQPETVTLVEVKYRRQLVERFFTGEVEKLLDYWSTAYIFIATPRDFFMDSCSSIQGNGGSIPPFSECGFIEDLDNLGKRKIRAYHDIFRNVLGFNKPESKQKFILPEKFENHRF